MSFLLEQNYIIKEEIREKSTKALFNIYEYSSYRVEQLKNHLAVLSYFMSEPSELEEMYRLVERAERTAKNRERYKKIKEAIEYELLRRELEKF